MDAIVTYRAVIRWGSFIKTELSELFSLHRICLLQISRGYKTITVGLNIIIGITIKYDFTKSNDLHLYNEFILQKLFPQMKIQSIISFWQIRTTNVTSHLRINSTIIYLFPTKNITVYPMAQALIPT